MEWIKWVHHASSLIKASTPSKITHEGFLAGFQHRTNDAGSKKRYRKLYHLHHITFPPISKLSKVNKFVNDFLKNILKKKYQGTNKLCRPMTRDPILSPMVQKSSQPFNKLICNPFMIIIYVYIYTIYPLYNESIVIISQSLCIPHVQPCTRCDFQQLLWLGWWRCIEVDGILWSHTWTPKTPTTDGNFRLVNQLGIWNPWG